MDKDISKKAMRTYLYIGIVMMVLGNVVLTCFSDVFPLKEKAMGAMDAMGYNYGWIAIFLMACVWAPISEELSFRLWVKKGKTARIISFILMSLMLTAGLFTQGWAFVTTVVVIMGLIYFLPALRNSRIHLLFITSSVLFGLLHWSNFELGIGSVFYFSALIGAGFVFAFLAYRFGLRYSILGHFLNNLFAISFLIYGVMTFSTLEGKGPNYAYRLKAVKFVNVDDYTDKPQLSINGDPTKILAELSATNRDTIFLEDDDSGLLTQLEVFGDGSEINKQALKNQLISRLDLDQKVSTENGYVLFPLKTKMEAGESTTTREYVLRLGADINDFKGKLVADQADEFIYYLWEQFQLPIVLSNDADMNMSVFLKADFYGIKDKDEALEYLRNSDNFRVEDASKPITVLKYIMK